MTQLLSSSNPLPAKIHRQEGFRTMFSAAQFTPAANPTDIVSVVATNYDRVVRVDRIAISATADSAAVIDVLVQQTAHHASGTAADMIAGLRRGLKPYAPNAAVYASSSAMARYYTANKTSNGNGVSSSRPLIASRKMLIGTPVAIGTQAVFEWADGTGPEIRDLVNSIVVNLNGQGLPANCRISVDEIVVSEIRLPRVTFSGDSLIASAPFFWSELNQGDILSTLATLDNLALSGGTIGYSASGAGTYLSGANGHPYPQSAVVAGRCNDIVIFGQLTNDVRTGQVDEALATSYLTQAVAAVKTARPDALVLLKCPGAPSTDNPTNLANAFTLSGQFAGMTLAQATIRHTEIIRNAYESFEDSPLVAGVYYTQDHLGPAGLTLADGRVHSDILHFNEYGQRLDGRAFRAWLLPFIERRISEVNC